MKNGIKTSVSALALATFMANSAYAADIDRSVDPTSVASEQPFSWTGGYIGAQIGYGISNQNLTTIENFPEVVEEVPSKCWANFNGQYRLVEKDPTPTTADNNKSDLSGDEDVFFFPINIDVLKTNVESQEDCDKFLGYLAHKNGQYASNQTFSSTPKIDRHDLEGISTHGFSDAETIINEARSVKSHSEGSDSGITGGIQVGFDKQLGRIVLGAFGDVNWSAIDGKDFDWTIGARAGFLVDPRFMIYGLAGYTQAEFDEATYAGWTVGAGAEYAMTRNIFVGGKYTYTDYDNETLVDTPSLKIDSDRDEHRIMADIKIKLNGESIGLGF